MCAGQGRRALTHGKLLTRQLGGGINYIESCDCKMTHRQKAIRVWDFIVYVHKCHRFQWLPLLFTNVILPRLQLSLVTISKKGESNIPMTDQLKGVVQKLRTESIWPSVSHIRRLSPHNVCPIVKVTLWVDPLCLTSRLMRQLFGDSPLLLIDWGIPGLDLICANLTDSSRSLVS